MGRWAERAAAAALVLALCLGLAACGGGGKSAASLSDLQTAMLSADMGLPDMTTVSSDSEDAATLFTYLSDLDYGKVDGFFLAYSSRGLADEVAVIALKDGADVPAAVSALRAHVQSRVDLYTSYQPDQVTRAQNALVFSRGNYAVLIIGDRQDDIKAAFDRIAG